MNGDQIGPINLGNPDEYTVKELSTTVQTLIDPNAQVVFKDLPSDDPRRRKPDITKAKSLLKWSRFVVWPVCLFVCSLFVI